MSILILEGKLRLEFFSAGFICGMNFRKPGSNSRAILENSWNLIFAGIVPWIGVRWTFYKSGAALKGLQWSGDRRGSRKWPQEKFRVN